MTVLIAAGLILSGSGYSPGVPGIAPTNPVNGTAMVDSTVSASLASVAISPNGTLSLTPNAYVLLQASALGSNNQSLTSVTSFVWAINPITLASLNDSSGQLVNLTIGSGTGTLTLCLNGTYLGIEKMACDFVSISLAPSVLSSIWVTPGTLAINTSVTQRFYADPLDQYNQLYTSQVQYQWTLSSSLLGTVTPTSGTGNTTLFVPGDVAASGSLEVTAQNGSIHVERTINIVVTIPIPPIMSVSVSPTDKSLATDDSQTFTAIPTCASTCTQSPTYKWALNLASMGNMSSTSGTSITFTAGSKTGTVVLYVNATLNGKMVGSNTTITIISNSSSGPASIFSGIVLYVIIGAIVVVALAVVVLIIRARSRNASQKQQGKQSKQGSRQSQTPPNQL
jgi:hypothetical protein